MIFIFSSYFFRFTRTSSSRTWNTGNGSPDAICFSVDKSGIFIVGCCIYRGLNTNKYEVELLDDTSAPSAAPAQPGSDPRNPAGPQSQRWNSLEIAYGTDSSEDCAPAAHAAISPSPASTSSPAGDITEIKFDKAVAIKPNVKYALRLRSYGGRTNNGDGGTSSVKGPDGTTFTFSSCSLSFNGTNPTRGQIPSILYYSSPAESPIQSSTKSMAELYSRRTALSMTSTIVKTVTNLLVVARDSIDEKGLEVLNSAPIITKLLPHVFASISSLVASDPQCAVQILGFIQDLLPSAAALNNVLALHASNDVDDESPDEAKRHSNGHAPAATPHYAWVESEHPYKPAGVTNHKLVFPDSVRWMSVEFDPRCATAQMEDVLQLYIRNPTAAAGGDDGGLAATGAGKSKSSQSLNRATPTTSTASGGATVTTPLASTAAAAGDSGGLLMQQKYIPVLKKFSGGSGWPGQAVILPGNEIMFSLETASDYVKDEDKVRNVFVFVVAGMKVILRPHPGKVYFCLVGFGERKVASISERLEFAFHSARFAIPRVSGRLDPFLITWAFSWKFGRVSLNATMELDISFSRKWVLS